MKYGDTPHLFLHHELCPRSLLEQSLQKNVEAARFTKELLPLLVQGRIAPVEPDFKCEESCWIKSNALKHCKYPYFPVMFIGISFSEVPFCFKTRSTIAHLLLIVQTSSKQLQKRQRLRPQHLHPENMTIPTNPPNDHLGQLCKAISAHLRTLLIPSEL